MTRTARSTRNTRTTSKTQLLRGIYACLGLGAAYGLHLTVTALAQHPHGQATANYHYALVLDQLLLVLASAGLYRHFRTAPGPMCWASYLAASPAAAYFWLTVPSLQGSMPGPLALTVLFANVIASIALVTFGHHCTYTRRRAESELQQLRAARRQARA